MFSAVMFPDAELEAEVKGRKAYVSVVQGGGFPPYMRVAETISNAGCKDVFETMTESLKK